MNGSHFKLHFKITFSLSNHHCHSHYTGFNMLVSSGEQQLKVKGGRWTLVNSGWFHNHLLRSCKAEMQIRLTHEHTHDIHQHNKQLVLLELWHDCDLLGSSGLDWNSSDSCDSRCACSSGCPVSPEVRCADDVTRPPSRCGIWRTRVSREWTKRVKSEDWTTNRLKRLYSPRYTPTADVIGVLSHTQELKI